MLITKTLLTVFALALPLAGIVRDEGQGTAQPGAHLDQLRMGNHLLGASFDSSAMLGKVVIVEIGGG